jgi:hypothetical protein
MLREKGEGRKGGREGGREGEDEKTPKGIRKRNQTEKGEHKEEMELCKAPRLQPSRFLSSSMKYST